MFLLIAEACSFLQTNNYASGINTRPPEAPQTHQIIVASPPDGWYEEWLNKTPCTAPCWEGITPGKTTASEAEDVLRMMPYAHDIQITPQLVPGTGVIGWKLANNNLGQIVYRSDDAKNEVTEITPPIPQFALAEIIAAYGKPSHVIAQAVAPPDVGQSPVYSLRIIYLNYGILLEETHIPSVKPEVNLQGQFNVRFFVSTKDGFRRATGIDITDKVVKKWNGLESFDFYCTDDSNGFYCQGYR